jgi:hypothetical protein
MKSIKYILPVFILISILGSSFSPVVHGIQLQRRSLLAQAPDQEHTFGFFETYSWTEVLSGLDPDDRIFQLLETGGEDNKGCRLGSCQSSHTSELWAYVHGDSFQKKVPEDLLFAWGAGKDQQNRVLYALKQPGALKGPGLSQIQDVSVKESEQGSYDIFISFSEEGARQWADLTGANVGRSIAIVFNDLVYAAPRVMESIRHGKCMISGDFDENDVKQILAVLDQ